MFEQDYIMRQIQQFANALEQVLFKKREGNQQEAVQTIEQSLNVLASGNATNFQDIALEETVNAISQEGKFNAELAWLIADLLYEQGTLVQDKTKTHKCYMQALLLYNKAMEHPEAAYPLEATQKINHIEEILESSQLDEVNQQL